MASNLIPAIWRGPWDGLLSNMGTLKRGDQYLVTEKDLLSDWWERVKPAKRGKPDADTQDAEQTTAEASD